MIIDTHCHLDDERYSTDLEEVIARASTQSIGGIVIPGADIKDLSRGQEIAHAYENIYFAAGVHPYHIEDYDEKILRKYLSDEKCIARGE